MKLTREQVSQLSDVELNRAMHDHYWVVNSGEPFDEFFNSVGADKLNYLTDYNLTMPLAISANLELSFIYNEGFTSCDAVFNDDIACQDCNPLRAICEVLLMIAMERE